MFGTLKRGADPLGPFEFAHNVDIGKPAGEVYPLLDWADPRNAKRALGNKIEHLDASPTRFRLWLDLVPGHCFEIVVTDQMPGRHYAFRSEIVPPMGWLVSSHETYRIEPLDEASCRLHLSTSATFAGGMSDQDFAMETTLMSIAGQNALAKLKVQAEQGPEAVHALEALQMDCGED